MYRQLMRSCLYIAYIVLIAYACVMVVVKVSFDTGVGLGVG